MRRPFGDDGPTEEVPVWEDEDDHHALRHDHVDRHVDRRGDDTTHLHPRE